MTLDTYAIVQKLKGAGFSEDQAEAVTTVIRDASETDFSGFAMKTDLREIELRLEAKIEAAKAETIKWVLSAIGFQAIVIVGAIVALSRGLH